MKLISLNIEASNHLDRVLPFLQQESADVVCLQEVIDTDVEALKKSLHMDGVYVPAVYINIGNKPEDTLLPIGTHEGTMILFNEEPKNILLLPYVKQDKRVPSYNGIPNNVNRFLLGVELQMNQTFYRVFTTHFTWTPNGKSSSLQFEDMDKMLTQLDTFEQYILCGDFNAPRGGEIWRLLTNRLHDNIPQSVTTTLDPVIHRIKNLQLVVDGIFSTPSYLVTGVRLESGISDHQALIATLTTAI